jgi:cellulose synthase/poly-beta-1,6-N-acetylglucosamine synthase-like glycosyltransferase
MQSIIDSTYKNIELIVVSDHSTDKTNSIVRKFKKDYPKHRVTLIARRVNQGKGAGLNYAIDNYASGEIVMVVDADCMVDIYAIDKGVAHFDNPNVVGVASNVRIIEYPSLLTLLQIFEYLVAYRSKKFYSMTGSEMIIGGVGSYFRKDVIKKYHGYDSSSATEDIGLSMKVAAHGGKTEKLVYAADSQIYTESVMTFNQLVKQRYRWKFGMIQNLIRFAPVFIANRKRNSKSLVYYRMPTAFISEFLLLLEPVLFTFIMTLTVATGNLSIFTGAYLVLTAYVAYILMSDEHLSLRSKLFFAPFLPYVYFLFYVMSLVQLLATIRCLSTMPALIKRDHSNTWISPTRQGSKARA